MFTTVIDSLASKPALSRWHAHRGAIEGPRIQQSGSKQHVPGTNAIHSAHDSSKGPSPVFISCAAATKAKASACKKTASLSRTRTESIYLNSMFTLDESQIVLLHTGKSYKWKLFMYVRTDCIAHTQTDGSARVSPTNPSGRPKGCHHHSYFNIKHKAQDRSCSKSSNRTRELSC